MIRSVAVRPLRAVAFMLAAVVPAEWASAAVPPSGVLAYDIFRQGTRIGTHVIRFSRQGDDLVVDIDIELTVRLLVVTLYEYEHRNREVWRDGRLVSIETRTDDNGEAHEVRGEAVADGLRVQPSGRAAYVAPADIIPTSYWNEATIFQDQLLNTQDGQLMSVRLREGRETRITAGEREIEAKHYIMEGDLRLELWYDMEDLLVRIRFTGSDGSVIDYAMRPPGA